MSPIPTAPPRIWFKIFKILLISLTIKRKIKTYLHTRSIIDNNVIIFKRIKSIVTPWRRVHFIKFNIFAHMEEKIIVQIINKLLISKNVASFYWAFSFFLIIRRVIRECSRIMLVFKNWGSNLERQVQRKCACRGRKWELDSFDVVV